MELYQDRINSALDFIEKNLINEITLDEVADSASYSKFHFMRVFKTITGNKLGDYIRKRRISESANELVTSGSSILSIALKYQFETQESYTRSFQSVFEVTPGFYRKRGHKFVGFEKYKLSSEQLKAILNYVSMEPKIITIEDKKLIGMYSRSSLAENKIVEVWKAFMPRREEIRNVVNSNLYSLHYYDSPLEFEEFNENTIFNRWAAVEVSEYQDVPNGMHTRDLTGGTYAVFLHKGPVETFRKTLTHIHKEWLPASEFEYDHRDQFEILGEKYFGPHHPNSEEEVWVPIKQK